MKYAIYFTLKDHQGSLAATVHGNTVERLSYDSWGRRRNTTDLGYDNIAYTFDRGYTLHEHYEEFDLINMNGRLYDPILGRMLSPDVVIQDEQSSQAYNRYSYCFNNPLRFTDPSGYVVTIPPEFNSFYYPLLLEHPDVYTRGTSPNNNREYGGYIDNGVVIEEPPGPIKNPRDEQYNSIEIHAGYPSFHSHSSGYLIERDRTVVYDYYWIQEPSLSDIQNAGNHVHYVFGRWNNHVYIYNINGVQTIMRTNNFINIGL